jgi:hypothetical protein
MSAASGGEAAAKGDQLLAQAATALASGNLNDARGFLASAKAEYKQVYFLRKN